MNTQLQNDLKSEFSRLGIAVTDEQIPTVLQMGAETFAAKHGRNIDNEPLTTIHLILNEMRNN